MANVRFQPVIQAGTPAGGDVGDFGEQAGLLDGHRAFAATDESVSTATSGFGNGLGHQTSADVEWRILQRVHRAVPEHSPRLADDLDILARGARADVQAHEVAGDLARLNRSRDSASEFLGAIVIFGESQLPKGVACRGQDRRCRSEILLSAKALADQT